MAMNDEIARDLTLAIIEAVGVIDTSGGRKEVNRNRAREVGDMYALIYQALCEAKGEDDSVRRAAD